MYLSFERSGGITGIPIRVTFDTSFLSSEEVSHLSQLVESSRFFELPAVLSASAQPDRFRYKIAVREGDRQHGVMVDEAAVSETLKPLLEWLLKRARRE
jgi:hypothetical protein